MQSPKHLPTNRRSGASRRSCRKEKYSLASSSTRIAEKDGDNGKVAAAAISSERGQMGGGNSTKMEAVKRCGQIQMKKEAKLLRCTLLSGSAWSTERKYMKKYKESAISSLGIEHRLKKEEMEEQFNKEAKEGWGGCSGCSENSR